MPLILLFPWTTPVIFAIFAPVIVFLVTRWVLI